MRLFLGTFLYDRDRVTPSLLDKIPFDDLQTLFRDDLKTIKKENIHITWIFLGNVDDSKIERVLEIISKYQDVFKGLIFQSKQLELWPPKTAPRLIVLSGELNKEIDLNELSNELKTVCTLNIKEDFLPHITIARFKKDKTVRAGFTPAHLMPEIKLFSWKIKEVCLIQSVLSSEGARYEKIKNWDLN